MKFHVEKFDSINEMALIWVRMPRLTANAKTEKIWMYYGNSAAVKGEDIPGSYDAHQALVYHFSSPDSITKDLTAYGNNPAKISAESNPASFIGAGVRFAGKNVISINATPSLQLVPEAGWTFSTWIKIDTAQQDAYLLQNQDNSHSLVLGIDGATPYARFSAKGGEAYETPKSAEIAPGNWHHVALIAGSGKLIIYVDGNEASSLQVPLQTLQGNITLGADESGAHFFSGEMDEVGIANMARSADWVKAVYRSQNVGSTMLNYGEDEKAGGSGGSSSYFYVILQSVTMDGWVVIAILMVMAAISWIVMLGKGMFIRRVRKDNHAFLQQFKRLGTTDPGTLDHDEDELERELEDSPISMALFGKHDHFQSSSLYHIYHGGIKEVQYRLGKSVGAEASALSSQAVNVIRATLDAALVRESQKLNAQMVLLTIAISGGPFLGLLGTVVGVMITFAAIAATGDVNVNAIAPGIAAALVATVAGLAVAIPALFGYNYLASRIKDTVADMHVFVDEFVTRIAEYYGK